MDRIRAPEVNVGRQFTIYLASFGHDIRPRR
jgi:hypothetical protein